MYTEPEPMSTIYHQPMVKNDSLLDGVIVPGLQCVITGALFGLTAAILVALAGGEGWWKVGCGIWAVATLISWLMFRSGWQARLERMLGIDLNGDGRIGQSAPQYLPAPKIRVEVAENNGHDVRIIDLPAEPEKVALLARGVIGGRSFAQSVWVAPGLFTRNEFTAVQDECVARGLARWKNERVHQQGCELTAKGRAVMRSLAEYSPAPELPDGRA